LAIDALYGVWQFSFCRSLPGDFGDSAFAPIRIRGTASVADQVSWEFNGFAVVNRDGLFQCFIPSSLAMTSFANLQRERAAIAGKYIGLITRAEASREREYWAAMAIRRAWIGHRRRQALVRRRAMATRIQKAFRQYLARTLVGCLRVEAERKRRRDYFNAQATKIQALWRGYRERRRVAPVRA
jgi:hypothetical protein